MVALLSFLLFLLSYLASLTTVDVLQTLVGIIPKSMYSIRKCLDRGACKVREYTVCPKCHF